MSINESLQLLTQVMLKVSELYTALIECLEVENILMTNIDTKNLLEVTQTKELLLAEILNLDAQRKNLVFDIAQSLGTQKEMSLLELAAIAPAELKEKLGDLHKVLNLQIQQCKNLNKQNMDLAVVSLDRIDLMKKNILGKGNNNAENYNAQGNRNPINDHGGRLLSKKA